MYVGAEVERRWTRAEGEVAGVGGRGDELRHAGGGEGWGVEM